MIWLFAPCLVAPCLVAPYSPYNVSADRPCAPPASFARLPFAPFELPVRPASLIRLASAAAVALRLASVALRFLLLFEPPAEALLLAPPELDRGEQQPLPARRAASDFPSYPVEPQASPAEPEASPVEPEASPVEPEASPVEPEASAQRAQCAQFLSALPRFPSSWEYWSEAHRCR